MKHTTYEASKMWHAICKRIFFPLLFILSVSASASDWTPIAPGLSYKAISNSVVFSNGTLHAFQIDPKTYAFESALVEKSIPEQMQQTHAVIGVNGGFFSPEMKPLGLRVSSGKELSPIKKTGWWGIFYIKHNRPHIVSQNGYKPDAEIDFAIQAGPRLLVDGQIPKLKPGIAYRTALGIQPSGNVILLATENLLLSTEELAEIMRSPEKDGGLNCTDALNLDGGRSTQLYTRLTSPSLQIPGPTQVADAVLVIAKEKTS